MSIPHYKLTYFPIKGRAEYIRILFAFAGVPFEDERVQFDTWMSTIKQTMPFGTIPHLDIDNGKEWIGQHIAIGRYLAKRFGIAGKDALDQAKADMYVDGTAEMWAKWAPVYQSIMAGDKEAVKQAGDKFFTETFIPWAHRYTKFLSESGSGWFVGDTLTWADIYIAEWIDRVPSCIGHHVLDEFPTLKAHCGRVKNIPQIAKYFQSRPETPF